MSRTPDAIPAQLRAERLRLGLTLPGAEDKVGIPGVVIGAYERGDRVPPLDKLRTWSEGLGHHLIAVPTTNGSTAAAVTTGQMRIEYGVAAGDLLLPADSEEDARALAKLMAGAVVVSRSVHLTVWEPQR